MKNNQHGYTLIELMVTLIILGIMSAIVIPNVNPILAGLEMRSAARQLYADIYRSKITAMEQQKLCCFAVNGTVGWSIVEDTDNDNVCDANDTKIKTFSLTTNYPDISFNATIANPIQFDRIGLVTNASTLQLVNSKYDKSANVTVTISGFISMQ